MPAQTACLTVEELAKDGRALLIPVVSYVAVKLERVPEGLTRLQASAVEDVTAIALAQAERLQ